MMGGASAWRMASAVGLIVFLAGVLFWQLIDRTADDEFGSNGATMSTAGLKVVNEEDSWIAAAQAALDAWALYASTGDLAVVQGFIDPKGPQFAQLLGEAPAIVPGGGSYSFVLDKPAVAVRDGFPVVSAEIVVSLDAEPIENLAWDIHLVERAGDWLLWTVEER